MSERVHLKHESMVVSVIYMALGALFLFWAPLANGFVAGAVGGWRAHDTRRAVLAAVLSSLASWFVMFLGWRVFKIDDLNVFMRLGLGGWAGLTLAGMLLGAIPASIVARYTDGWDLVPVQHRLHRRRTV